VGLVICGSGELFDKLAVNFERYGLCSYGVLNFTRRNHMTESDRCNWCKCFIVEIVL
jgi:hypothetical protein